MRADSRSILKALSPRIGAKALALLDKSTAVVVSTCWLAALVTLILAVIAVHNAVAAKHESAEALVAEPVLPVATTTPITQRDSQQILERLQHQFPDIKFEIETNQAITIKSDDGAKFHQWVTAISYIDTMAPQIRWTLRDFCVGHCSSNLMKAVVIGQKVVFTLPPPV
jgi:hypothetical protein